MHEDLTPAWSRSFSWDPVLDDHVLICENSGYNAEEQGKQGIVGLNPRTGKLIWEHNWSSLVLGKWQHEVIIQGSQKPTIAGLDAKTGKVLWRLPWTVAFAGYIFGSPGAYAFNDDWMILAVPDKDKYCSGSIMAYKLR